MPRNKEEVQDFMSRERLASFATVGLKKCPMSFQFSSHMMMATYLCRPIEIQ